MATTTVLGVEQAKKAMRGLAPAVQNRWMRVAISAAMGLVKGDVVANLKQHQDTGLNVKSQRVKTVVPAASQNTNVHDKPAYGLVGAGRGLAGVMTARGKTRILTAKQKGHAKATAKLTKIKMRMASRYSHFPEKKHHDLERAANSAGPAALKKFASKIAEGIKTEAARLASKP